jgi:hypothetical protein
MSKKQTPIGKILTSIAAMVVGVAIAACAGAAEAGRAPFIVPVVVVKFFPAKDGKIDAEATGGFTMPLPEAKGITDKITETTIYAMEEGSRYHGYKDRSAKPSLDYEVIKTFEFAEPTPRIKKGQHYMPEYNEIMKKIDGRSWIEERGVKEVWIFSYHTGAIGLWESNMSSPYGDISNSDRDLNDLPVYKKTYTVYTYNYGRGPSEALENHIHQIEHVLNWIDGRDRTPGKDWAGLLFWGKFVGSDISHKMIPTKDGIYRCGWAHYPPNAKGDYDWQNSGKVMSDIEDWKPEGTGKAKEIGSDVWKKDSYRWFVYWMQAIPGMDSGLAYGGKLLTNWWIFIGDFDLAMQQKINLVGAKE